MTQAETNSHRFCVAPMIDWTDRHCRHFHRQLSRRALLYTEMITTGAILFGDQDRHLAFDAAQHPVALQLGGSDPAALAEAAGIGAGYGYDEINLNVGCPSDRVQNGAFGACLMAEPDLVAGCVKAMRDAVSIPVTVKCRIGIDDQDEDRDFQRFVETVADGGCDTFIVHARKAWLQGLSPKENREIPPLNYPRVYRLKEKRADLTVVINGGLTTIDEALAQLEHVDGVMLGRAAYQNPWLLNEVDEAFFSDPSSRRSDRVDVINAMANYADDMTVQGVPLNSIARHMMGLFNGCRGGRAYRRYISENARGPDVGGDVIKNAAAFVQDAPLAA